MSTEERRENGPKAAQSMASMRKIKTGTPSVPVSWNKKCGPKYRR